MQNENKIRILTERVNNLSKVLEKYQEEIASIKKELKQLHIVEQSEEKTSVVEETITPLKSLIDELTEKEKQKSVVEKQIIEEVKKTEPVKVKHVSKNSSLEDYIGGNLISKIGIAILIIGLGIFVKYAIDKNLISEEMRIAMAYLAGAALLGAAYWTEKKYQAYSSVLLSGGVATLYFTTYIAYDFYQMYPHWLTFLLMLIVSGFTVFAATRYKQEVIGIIGLVGAYAIPIITSTGRGDVVILFSYIALINIVILVIAFKQDWQATHWVAFVVTWLVFASWFIIKYSDNEAGNFNKAFIFNAIYFATFQAITLVYKLLRKEMFKPSDVLALILNAFVFYAIGMAMYADERSKQGLFTFANALLHGGIAYGVLQIRNTDRNIFYAILAIALAFLTIGIPVEFKGNWIPILWSVQAIGLFTIGRLRNVLFYEKGAGILVALSVLALLRNWANVYYQAGDYYNPGLQDLALFGNNLFLTSCFVMASLGAIVYLSNFWKPEEKQPFQRFLEFAYLVGFIGVSYFTFFNEIRYHFYFQYVEALDKPGADSYTIKLLMNIWLMNYTLIYLNIGQWINYRFSGKEEMHRVASILVFITLIAALNTFSELNDLRNNAISNETDYNQWLRYLTYFLLAALLVPTRLLIDKRLPEFRNAFIIATNVLAIIIVSLEWTNGYVLRYANADNLYAIQEDSYKLGYSILWGLYSFGLIAYGFWKKKRLQRIMGIVLFGATLFKLFFLDLSYVTTISKIITFIALGILLLLVSFLYQKYKHIILAEDEEKEEV